MPGRIVEADAIVLVPVDDHELQPEIVRLCALLSGQKVHAAISDRGRLAQQVDRRVASLRERPPREALLVGHRRDSPMPHRVRSPSCACGSTATLAWRSGWRPLPTRSPWLASERTFTCAGSVTARW